MAGVLLLVGCSTGAEVDDGTWFVPSGGGHEFEGTDTDAESETGDPEDGDSGSDTTSSAPEPPLPPHPEPEPEPEPMGTTGDPGSTTDEPPPGTTTGEATEDCTSVLLTHLDGLPLNVRAAPHVGAALVGTMLEGQVVDVLAEVVGQPVNIPPLGVSDVWLEVDDGVVQGYVTSLYTECTSEP